MIDKESLSEKWLSVKRRQYKKDPAIIGSMIRALYLLDRLMLTGLDFIFKGGTSLVLLMEKPLRFSVDIDIIVSPDLNRMKLEEYLEKIPLSGEFIRYELDERRSYKEGIPKAHYKFIYSSGVPVRSGTGEILTNPEREILLDVLFCENPYPVLTEKPVQTEWVLMEGEPAMVKTPDINSIAGDKLVAFAPCTTGVPYGVGKEKEIIKQLFDVGNLFQLIDDFEVFRRSWFISADGEMNYRPERKINSPEEVLEDTIATALLIARREYHEKGDEDSKLKFAEIGTGINQFSHYVFEGNFRIDHAQVASAKAAYLAAVLLSDYRGKLVRFDPKIPLTDFLIGYPEYNYLNKRLKYIASGEALFYWYHTINLLQYMLLPDHLLQ